MKAKLDFYGKLTVTAETSTEEYTLLKWWQEHQDNKASIVIESEFSDIFEIRNMDLTMRKIT